MSRIHQATHRRLWLSLPFTLLLTIALLEHSFQTRLAHPHDAPLGVISTNNFPGQPNCTWYAWQRVHDVEHIDLQVHGNAGDWIREVTLAGAGQVRSCL